MKILDQKTLILETVQANISTFPDRVLLTVEALGLQVGHHMSATDARALSAALLRAADVADPVAISDAEAIDLVRKFIPTRPAAMAGAGL